MLIPLVHPRCLTPLNEIKVFKCFLLSLIRSSLPRNIVCKQPEDVIISRFLYCSIEKEWTVHFLSNIVREYCAHHLLFFFDHHLFLLYLSHAVKSPPSTSGKEQIFISCELFWRGPQTFTENKQFVRDFIQWIKHSPLSGTYYTWTYTGLVRSQCFSVPLSIIWLMDFFNETADRFSSAKFFVP